ncbi:ion-transporting P-type ATPase [Paratrimastix pyriformis]|uniref:Ion-transporting P-type ATPase n=1 Tax=Paratrimastix pyriformis TaxID=342808 RepID=A0ABQ8UVH9_9EUKA|nr:ion-transporting P-type ATPase [Paratrimastix pyriformis]
MAAPVAPRQFYTVGPSYPSEGTLLRAAARRTSIDLLHAAELRRQQVRRALQVAPGAPPDKAASRRAHLFSKQELQDEFSTDLSLGLSQQQRSTRLSRDGKNALTPPKQLPEWLKFLKAMVGGFSLLLLLGGLLSLIAYLVPFIPGNSTKPDPNNLYIAIVLVVVVILTGIFQYMQEAKSSKILAGFKDLIPTQATIRVQGALVVVNAQTLVAGDLCELAVGQKVPADIRLIDAHGLKVDNSSLTGESEPQPRTVKSTSDSYLETKNIAFFGTSVLEGRATGVVVATGDRTVIGEIAHLASQTGALQTSLGREINRFVKIVAVFAFSMGILFAILGLALRVGSWLDSLIFGLGIIVANVPEGLYATTTVCLTLTARRMAGRNVLVKNLQAVETLGSVSVICTDKTGTLTQNRMTLSHLWFDSQLTKVDADYTKSTFRTEPSLVSPSHEEDDEETTERSPERARNATFQRLLQSMNFCSRAIFDSTDPSLPDDLRAILSRVAPPPPIEAPASPRPGILRRMSISLGFRPRLQRSRSLPALPVLPEVVASPPILGFPSRPATPPLPLKANLAEMPTLSSGAPPPPLLAAPEHTEASTATQTTQTVQKPPVSSARQPVPKKWSLLDAKVIGDASETAIFRFASSMNNVLLERESNPRLAEVPFNSATKTHLVIHKFPEGNVLFFKGAPERVLEHCSSMMMEGGEYPLDERSRIQVMRTSDELASLGERVLAFAFRPLDPTAYPEDYEFVTDPHPNFPTDGYVLLGLASLQDPPRETVPEAVLECQKAGLRVIMVTGDHPTTAKAIARQCHIISFETEDEIVANHSTNPQSPRGEGTHPSLREIFGDAATVGPLPSRPPTSQTSGETHGVEAGHSPPGRPLARARVVTGDELHAMSAGELEIIIGKYEQLVFARVSPVDKLTIVEACQKNGAIVGVTGDGVNDSPALKKADIGISMGISGSDVSREAADIVLLDDNFASIVHGIEEGRLVFDNLQKSIAYVLASNIPEIVPFILFFLVGVPAPLTVILVLLIDLGTDIFPAISFGYEPAERGLMDRPPRNPKRDRLVTWRLIFFAYAQIGVLETVAAFITYFLIMGLAGIPMSSLFFNMSGVGIPLPLLRTAQSSFFFTVVLTQIGNILLCKTRRFSLFRHPLFKNKHMFLAILVELLIALFLVYVPWMHVIIATNWLAWPAAAVGGGFIFILIFYDEIRKLFIRSWPHTALARVFTW